MALYTSKRPNVLVFIQLLFRPIQISTTILRQEEVMQSESIQAILMR